MDFAEGMKVHVEFGGMITSIIKEDYYGIGAAEIIEIEDAHGGVHTLETTVANHDHIKIVVLPLMAGDLLKGNDGNIYVARSNMGEGPEADHVYGVANTFSGSGPNGAVSEWLARNDKFELIYRLDKPVK
jgi:hypothetical protein